MPLQKQFLSTTRQRGTSQSWYFRGVSLLLLSTSRRCINKRLPLVPFWTASLSVTMGTQSSQLFCCEECLYPCWHTSSATNSLCAMGSTCMALIASRCKMNAFLVSISRKCKSTVPYLQQSCCGWTNTEWTGLVCQPLSQPSVHLHPPPFSSPWTYRWMVVHTGTSHVSIHFTISSGSSLIHLTDPNSHFFLLRVFSLPPRHSLCRYYMHHILCWSDPGTFGTGTKQLSM